MISKNAARCRVCTTIVESTSSQYETCKCGAIAIGGGSLRLSRSTRTWADLEELSEFSLSWRDVLDCKQFYRSLEQAASFAKMTGHMFFVFNDEVYRAFPNTAVKTGKTVKDLEGTEQCTVLVSQQ